MTIAPTPVPPKLCPLCGGDQFVVQEVEIVVLADVLRNSIYDPYPVIGRMIQYQYTCINPQCSEDLP